jgi:hypothetical protein
MTHSQFLDDPVSVDANLRNNRLFPKTIRWREQDFVVTTIGRQWAEEGGNHVLVELHNGSRMEITLLGDLSWRLWRYWPPVYAV